MDAIKETHTYRVEYLQAFGLRWTHITATSKDHAVRIARTRGIAAYTVRKLIKEAN